MLNQIVLMGRFVRDPELRRTQNDRPVVNFTLAVDRDREQDGERQADFIPVTAWNGTAEFVEKYFSKGKMACVKGRLQIRKWEDKDGNKRETAEVAADSVYFAG